MATIILPDVKATVAFGAEVAGTLRRGDVLALCGDLGAGKTHFTKGLAAGLEGDPVAVTSPTFTLLHEHFSGRLPLYHFDFYRLETPGEALRLGLEEYLDGDGVCVIEWADKFPELLPAATRWFRFAVTPADGRTVTEDQSPPL